MSVKTVVSKYKGVTGKIFNLSGIVKFYGRYKGSSSPPFNTERGAALWYDRKRIADCKNPVNILKKISATEKAINKRKEKIEAVNALIEGGNGVYDSCKEIGISKTNYYKYK